MLRPSQVGRTERQGADTWLAGSRGPGSMSSRLEPARRQHARTPSGDDIFPFNLNLSSPSPSPYSHAPIMSEWSMRGA